MVVLQCHSTSNQYSIYLITLLGAFALPRKNGTSEGWDPTPLPMKSSENPMPPWNPVRFAVSDCCKRLYTVTGLLPIWGWWRVVLTQDNDKDWKRQVILNFSYPLNTGNKCKYSPWYPQGLYLIFSSINSLQLIRSC